MFHVKHSIKKYYMAGVYLHVPFCFSVCGYCDFYKITKLNKMDRFQEVLLAEIAARSSEFKFSINTFYVGGGTPSLVDADFYKEVFSVLKQSYVLSSEMECTIEVNPDDVTEAYLYALRSAGFNRISIGIQSFHDTDLRQMGRRHNGVQARQAALIADLWITVEYRKAVCRKFADV